jgi:hypothetical protein
MSAGRAFPVEDFVQAFTAQLDRAQDLLALKARTGRPLTFALKDLAVDLHVFWEVDATGRTLMRHAEANEAGASTLRFNFTSITKAMAEENSVAMAADEDSRPLKELPAAAAIDEPTRRRLEWAGVNTVGQLRRLTAEPAPVEAFFGGDPVQRMQALLEQASRPSVRGSDAFAHPDGSQLLRIRGSNLTDGVTPEVRLAGDPVEVVHTSPGQLVVRPQDNHTEGQVEVFVGPHRATGFFRMPSRIAAAQGAYGTNGAHGSNGTNGSKARRSEHGDRNEEGDR